MISLFHWPKLQPDQIERREKADRMLRFATELNKTADEIARKSRMMRQANGFKEKVYGDPR